MVAPVTITIMIACAVSPEPGDHAGPETWHSVAGNETRRWLLENGLIDEKSKATEKGWAWLDYICATPLPEQRWILPPRAAVAEGVGASAAPAGTRPAREAQ